MRILIDTNVLVDYLAARAPYDRSAQMIIDHCQREFIDGCISSQSIADIFYILRKDFSVNERKRLLLALCRIFTVVGVDRETVMNALQDDGFSDFEDCLQSHCAVLFDADFIVTRNEKDYLSSTVPSISPETFCSRFLTLQG